MTRKLDIKPGETFIGFDADQVLSPLTPVKKVGRIDDIESGMKLNELFIVSFYFPLFAL